MIGVNPRRRLLQRRNRIFAATGPGRFDFGSFDAERRQCLFRQSIETRRIVKHGRVAPHADIGDDVRNRAVDVLLDIPAPVHQGIESRRETGIRSRQSKRHRPLP